MKSERTLIIEHLIKVQSLLKGHWKYLDAVEQKSGNQMELKTIEKCKAHCMQQIREINVIRDNVGKL